MSISDRKIQSSLLDVDLSHIKKIYKEFDDKALSTNDVRSAISKELKRILSRKQIHELVNHNKLPVADQNPAVFKDTEGLLRLDTNRKNEIHTDKHNLPDLLLDNLEREDMRPYDKIKRIHDRVTRVDSSINLAFLIGPSGCGKTRTILEYLSQHFGVFLTATTASNGGSADIENCLKVNGSGAAGSFAILIEFLNRIVIRLEILHCIKTEFEDRFQPWHWMIMQEIPHQIFGCDIFSEMSIRFQSKKAIGIAFNKEELEMPESLADHHMLPIFLDESQVLLASNNYLSATSTDVLINQLRRERVDHNLLDSTKPLINTLLYASHLLFPEKPVNKSKFVIFLSGTGLQVDEMETSVESMLLKSFKQRVYITLGSFLDYEPFKEYIQRYTHKLDKHLPELHSVLRGRYRFTAAFLANFLKCGDHHKALQIVRDNLKESIAKSLAVKHKLIGQPYDQVIRHHLQDLKSDFLRKLMIQYYFFDCTIAPKAQKSLEEIQHIQYGLALVSQNNNSPNFFTTVNNIVDEVKIAEPLIFELLHNSLINGKTYIKELYIETWLTSTECPSKLLPTTKGKLSEPHAVALFFKQLEEGELPNSLGLDGFKPFQRTHDRDDIGNMLIRESFSLNCDQLVSNANEKPKKISFGEYEFLGQNFDKREHKFIGIYPPMKVKGATDFLAVVGKEKDKKPTLVVLEIKDTQTNEPKLFNSIKKWKRKAKSDRITSKFKGVVFVVIQIGNLDLYDKIPKDVHFLQLDAKSKRLTVLNRTE